MEKKFRPKHGLSFGEKLIEKYKNDYSFQELTLSEKAKKIQEDTGFKKGNFSSGYDYQIKKNKFDSAMREVFRTSKKDSDGEYYQNDIDYRSNDIRLSNRERVNDTGETKDNYRYRRDDLDERKVIDYDDDGDPIY